MTLESTLKRALLLRAPRDLPDLRLFNRPILRVRLPDPDRTFVTGLKGQSDLYDLYRGGLHIELELKAFGGTLKPNQRIWRDFCRKWGVPHLVLQAYGGEEVPATVSRWCGEIRAAIQEHRTALPVAAYRHK
jgi:hypothetical protein